MSDEHGPTVSDIGEDALLRRIERRLEGGRGDELWAGDDTAVVAAPGARVLITTDQLVEGLDFDLAYCTGFDVGWKAIAANASDIAAMCGRPAHAVAAVGLRPDVGVAFFDDLLEGLLAASGRWGISLVGGDLSGAREISVAVALTGAPVGAGPVLRSGAGSGDALCITGTLGGAHGGLEILRRGSRSAATEVLVKRQLRPTARVEEAAALAELEPTAMIDVSDGLAVDLSRLLTASKAGVAVALEALPVDPALAHVSDLDPLEAAVLGGEDFELLFTIGADRVGDAVAALGRMGTRLTRLGTIGEGAATLGGRALESWKEKGWQHLHSP
jgi:thiamine-monophosphate kinase